MIFVNAHELVLDTQARLEAGASYDRMVRLPIGDCRRLGFDRQISCTVAGWGTIPCSTLQPEVATVYNSMVPGIFHYLHGGERHAYNR